MPRGRPKKVQTENQETPQADKHTLAEAMKEECADLPMPEPEAVKVISTHKGSHFFPLTTAIERLISNGIPVVKAEFKMAVNNASNVPENMFSLASDNPSRRVEMWLTTAGLICLQRGKYFGTPSENCKYWHFK